MRSRWGVPALLVAAAVAAVALSGCGKKVPPVARPVAPPPPAAAAEPASRPPAPPEPLREPVLAAPQPVKEDSMVSRSLDDLNRQSPLGPVFFALDSAEVSAEGQSALQANAEALRKYPAWVVTVEGHCDERGTAEYNLALGERRAAAARAYLVSLGIPAERLKTVSYGKEFPFDPAHTEEAWAKNRRAHFVITAK